MDDGRGLMDDEDFELVLQSFRGQQFTEDDFFAACTAWNTYLVQATLVNMVRDGKFTMQWDKDAGEFLFSSKGEANA